MPTPIAQTTVDMLADGAGDDESLFAQSAQAPTTRRLLVAAPSEGPIASGIQAEPSGDPTASLGQGIGFNEPGRGAPEPLPTPAPAPRSLTYTPAIYHNPNQYEFAPNLGGRAERTPLASIPKGEQLAYELREDWRRPAPIEGDAVTVGG